MNKTESMWTGGIAGASFIGAVAAAIPEAGFPFPYPGSEDAVDLQRMDRFVAQTGARLRLTAAQQQSLRVLLQRLQRASQALAADQDASRTGMLDLLAAPRLDQHASLHMLKARARAAEAEAPAVVEAFADFHDSLDETQRTRLRTFLATRMYGGFGYSDVAI